MEVWRVDMTQGVKDTSLVASTLCREEQQRSFNMIRCTGECWRLNVDRDSAAQPCVA